MYEVDALWQEFYRRMAQTAEAMIDPDTQLVRSSYVKDVPCLFCGSTESTTRAIVHGFRYVTCPKCGLVYINPQLTLEALRHVYNDEDVRNFFFNELLIPHGEKLQKREYEQRARALKTFAGMEKPRLLDVGCAAGNFLQVAETMGFQGEGLELNSHYVDYIRQNRAIKVFDKRLEEMNYPANSFDAVTLWDVLEHLPQPFQVLQEISRILNSGGVLALTTINHQCINEKILGSRWRYYQPPDHVCSFTPSLLKSMLKAAGFSTMMIEHHYMFEVLADAFGSTWKPSKRRTTMAKLLDKTKKISYILLSLATGTVFNAVHSGDLLTIYARKNG